MKTVLTNEEIQQFTLPQLEDMIPRMQSIRSEKRREASPLPKKLRNGNTQAVESEVKLLPHHPRTCKKCGAKLKVKIPKDSVKRQKKAYVYRWYLKCVSSTCPFNFMPPDAKVDQDGNPVEESP